MKNAKQLSRTEMKNVLGGVNRYLCTFTFSGGIGADTIYIDGANLAAAQTQANYDCSPASHYFEPVPCTGVVCSQ